MKQRTAVFAGLMALGICGASAAQAQPYYYGPRYYDAGLQPYEIMRVVRSAGLSPLSRPMRRGPTYVVVAANRSGGQMRVVVDAATGDIMTVNPMVAMRPYGVQPYYPGPSGAVTPYEPPGGPYGASDPRFDGGIPPVPPREVPSAHMIPAPGPAPMPGLAPREPANARVAAAPAHVSPTAPAPPARTPMPRPRPTVAASEPAATSPAPSAATGKAPDAPAPTAAAPAIINPANAPKMDATQMVPVAPLE